MKIQGRRYIFWLADYLSEFFIKGQNIFIDNFIKNYKDMINASTNGTFLCLILKKIAFQTITSFQFWLDYGIGLNKIVVEALS